MIGAHANAILKPYSRKIGPDPASINSGMIGGIAANNASGMCCGTAQNSYQTVDSMKVIVKDGTLVDTSDADSRKAFEKSHGDLLKELKQLSLDVKNNKALSDRITHKFKMKNTTIQKKVASLMAPRMGAITGATKVALNTSNLLHSLLGPKTMDGIADGLRNVSGNRTPKWNKYIPKAAPKVRPEQYTVKEYEPDKVVYFPSCINQTMGLPKGHEEDVPLTKKSEAAYT